MENKIIELEHGNQKEVEFSNIYCPSCGSYSVYNELCDGDYYGGVSYYCKSCNSEFCLPSHPWKIDLKWID